MTDTLVAKWCSSKSSLNDGHTNGRDITAGSSTKKYFTTITMEVIDANAKVENL